MATSTANDGIAPILIQNVTVIDGAGRPAQPAQNVFIIGNKIRRISREPVTERPANTRVIDGTGKFALPGLIDMHTHTSTWTPPLYVIHGVTSVMDTGNYPEWVFAQAEGIAKGRIFGARLYPVGKPISPAIEWVPDPRFATETIEQAVAVTRKMIDMGAAGIKVHRLTDGPMLRAVAEVAHEAGITVSGHLGLIDAREAANNGIDGLQHATGVALATIKDHKKLRRIREAYSNIGYSPVEFYMEPDNFDELIDDLLERHVTLIPTLYHYIGKKVCPRRREYFEEDQAFLRKLDPQFFPHEAVRITYSEEPYVFQSLPLNDRDSYLDKMEVGWKKLAEFISLFKKAGGTVLAGSDDGNVGLPGKGLHRELEILVKTCGFSPVEAIAAATADAARFLRHEELGAIREDKISDIVVLNADPLQEITNTQAISIVIQDGRIIDTTVAARYPNPLPLPAWAGSGPIPVAEFIPHISCIEPTSTHEGSGDISVAITGKNFAPVSYVRFDVSDLPTKYVGPIRLDVIIPASLLRIPGSYALTVTNPGSGGGPSNIADFIVRFKYSHAELAATASAANPNAS